MLFPELDKNTDTTMNVLQKLQLARVKLQGMELKKSGHNSFANYDYFELADFLPQTQTIFGELGLCGIVRYELDGCSLTIFNTEEPSDQLQFRSPWAEAQVKGCTPVQNLGAAQTYQRRYLWVTALEIVEHDTLDSTTGREEMVMTNRLVPKHYWDATDQIVKDKIIGAGNTIRKNDADKKWYICEPIDKADPLKHDALSTLQPESKLGQDKWTTRVEKVTQNSTAAGLDYWEIETEEGNCYCKNKQLVEELKMMGGEEVILTVQPNVRKGTYELVDFEGALA